MAPSARKARFANMKRAFPKDMLACRMAAWVVVP
jgi:hypothetical protein